MRIGFLAPVLFAAIVLTACGGGGGSSTPPTAEDTTPPSVPADLTVTATTTATVSLSWSASTDTGGSGLAGYRIYRDGSATPLASVAATTYTDSGLSPQTTYSYTVRAYDRAGNVSAATSPVSATTQQVQNVTVLGTVTFDRPSYTASNTLSFTNLQRLPVRGATVEILRASDQAVLATTTTDGTSGDYTATVPAGSFVVRVKAQLLKVGSGGYDFEIRNNTSGNALYTLDSSTVTPSGSSVRVDLNAATGWGVTSYTGTRAAAPFAILYMLWEARTLLQGAEQPTPTLPALDVYWSTLNSYAQCTDGRPDPTTGAIGTTFFLSGDLPATADCPATPAGIYVLGDASGNGDDDTDEFDSSVIAHELGHYFQANFSRDDSMGGPHSLAGRLDPTLAFSEGWGNAFQGFVLNSPWYRDTVGAAGNSSFAFDMENNSSPYQNVAEFGFYAETSIQDILWDIYDGANDDPVSLGYAPIDSVMRHQMETTDALTSIYVMANGLANDNPAQANAIATRMAAIPDKIYGTGDFGTGEGPVLASVNNSWPSDPWAIPVYKPVTLGVATTVVSTNRFADPDYPFYQSYNRLGSHRYLRIDLSTGGGLTIQVQGPVGSDPDFVLYKKGADQCPSGGACWGQDDSVSNGLEVASFSGLAAGTYVLDVYECSYLGELCRTPVFGTGDTTFSVTVNQP